MSRIQLIEALASARRDIHEAERALDAVIACIESAERADKTTITPSVESAFASLRSALARVIELERRLADLPEA